MVPIKTAIRGIWRRRNLRAEVKILRSTILHMLHVHEMLCSSVKISLSSDATGCSSRLTRAEFHHSVVIPSFRALRVVFRRWERLGFNSPRFQDIRNHGFTGAVYSLSCKADLAVEKQNAEVM